MSTLARAAVNFLLQQPSVVATVGEDSLGPWIFANQPDATIENSGDAMIVISSLNGWGANEHNTARFPQLIVDIWADPTRGTDLSVLTRDADLKVEAVFKAVDKFFHQLDNSAPNGGAIYWGTATQISNKTGVRIISSKRVDEPDVRAALNDEGALIGTVRYNVSI